MPFFSVIIPTYNRYELTKKSIESVLEQNYRDFELILIDDGSTDNTSFLEEEYHGKITYIRQDNSGVSSARNRGILSSNGEYITFLDSDDRWQPHKLKEHYAFIKENSGTKIHQTDETWIRKGLRVNPKIKHRKREGDIFIDSLELCLISPSAVCIKKDIFHQYGLFDTLMPACEDYDLWLRITSGEKTGLIEKNLVIKFGGHQDQLSKKYPVMDRFRVYSILKLIANQKIKEEYLNAAKETVIKKCKIIRAGAKKRGNISLYDTLTDIIDDIKNENYNRIDYESLLRREDFR